MIWWISYLMFNLYVVDWRQPETSQSEYARANKELRKLSGSVQLINQLKAKQKVILNSETVIAPPSTNTDTSTPVIIWVNDLIIQKCRVSVSRNDNKAMLSYVFVFGLWYSANDLATLTILFW